MINKINEKDLYCVYNDFDSKNYVDELYLLYLPLVESNAIKFYQFLATKILNDKNFSQNYLHYDLTDNLFLSMNEILVVRKKLEAIGLLETYFMESPTAGQYIYKLKEPLSFSEFLSNPMLSQLLKNKIGDNQFLIINNKYKKSSVSFNNFKNLTAKFSDVYTNANFKDYSFSSVKDNVKGPNLDEYYFDFSKLNYLLSSSYMGNILDIKENKDKILGLAHLYKATPSDMAKAIEKSINNTSGENLLNFDLLSEYLVQLFVNVRKQEVPILSKMLDKNLVEETEEKQNITEEEKFIKQTDNINYVNFLNKRHGLIVSTSDATSVTKLQEKYNFPTGVLNILLDHAIRNSKGNGIPNYNYLDKIASEWSAQKLLSSADAMEYVRSNKVQRLPKKQNINNTSYSNRSVNNVHKVKTPEYILEQIKTLDGEKEKQYKQITREDEDAYNKMIEELNNVKEGRK